MIRRENIRLTVSNIIFHLEKSDYVMLSSYLNDAKKYYHSLPNGQKQFQDFEFNISEFLLNKLKDGEQHTTSEHILKAMGSYGSFLIPDNDRVVKDVTIGEKKILQQGKSIASGQNSTKLILAALSILGLSF